MTSNRTRDWAQPIILIGLVLLAYLPALHGGFIWDDDAFLTANPLVHAPDGLRRFWLTGEPVDYWPVTSSSLWLEWRLWGLHAAGYHVTNVLLHLGEVVCFWRILVRLELPGAFLAAALFAVHPLNVESVVWITQRKNLMAMAFYLLSIGCFLRADGRGAEAVGRWWAPGRGVAFGVCLVAFALAMLSKGSVALLPVVFLGFTLWRGRRDARAFLRLLPFFVVAAVLTGVNLAFAHHYPEAVVRVAGPLERLAAAGAILWFYLGKALLPVHLLFVYPMWHFPVDDLVSWGGLLAVGALTAVLWHYRQRGTMPALLAWSYFCVSLIPVLGFTDVYFMRYSLVSDHYTHLALLGVCAFAGWAWSRWVKRTAPTRRWIPGGSAAVGVLLFTAMSVAQSRTYADLETLYRASLAGNADSWMVQNNLGLLLRDKGHPAEALGHFTRAAELNPAFAGSYYGRGLAESDLGHWAEADQAYSEAIRHQPALADAYVNRAKVRHDLGRPAEAFADLKQVLVLRPGDPEALTGIGNLLLESGQVQEAIRAYQQAAAAAPTVELPQVNLAKALAQSGRMAEAAQALERAVALAPGAFALHNLLGTYYAQSGRMSDAAAEFSEAARLAPGSFEAHMNLAQALQALGQSSRARQEAVTAANLAH